jgi:hypothetical protein
MTTKFVLPKIVQPLPIAEYAAGSPAIIHVWLNIPQDVLREHGEIIRENVEIKNRLNASDTAGTLIELAANPDIHLDEWKKQAGQVLEHDIENVADALPELEALKLDEAGLERIRQQLNAILEKRLAWFAKIWSQGADESTHWTLEEVKQLKEQTADTDPQFFTWLCNRTVVMIGEHRTAQKKIFPMKP